MYVMLRYRFIILHIIISLIVLITVFLNLFIKIIEYKLKENPSLSILWVLNSNKFDPISICSLQIQCKDIYTVKRTIQIIYHTVLLIFH